MISIVGVIVDSIRISVGVAIDSSVGSGIVFADLVPSAAWVTAMGMSKALIMNRIR